MCRMHAVTRRSIVALCFLVAAAAPLRAQSPAPVEELPILRAETLSDTLDLVVQIPRSSQSDASRARLFVAAGAKPLAVRDAPPPSQPRAELRIAIPAGQTAPTALRAWRICEGLDPAWVERWPDGALLETTIDSLGPGGRTAWLSGGVAAALRRDDRLWLRVGGQPVARFDVRLTAGELVFCTVAPLVRDPGLREGQSPELWPAPGDRRAGRARSAVSYIERVDDAELAWVVLPPRTTYPPDPLFEFFRQGRFVGRGVMERQDDLFAYVRVFPLTPGAGLAVGDDVAIRTLADVQRRRFAARVFEQTADGYLISAGEHDGLATAEAGTVWRDGAALGQVLVSRVQNAYTLVQAADAATRELLRPGDEVRFGPPPPGPRRVGVIEQVVDGRALLIRAVASDAAPRDQHEKGALPLDRPLAIRAGGRTVGVAILLCASDGAAAGIVLGEPAALSMGMELVADEP